MATPIPENRVELELGEIARATSGEARRGREQAVHGVTTDSRQDVSGKLFVALTGEHFDGHEFVADVARRGAAAVLVSRDVDVPSHVGVVRVRDTLAALGAVARFHRRRWGGTVVAVAGSAGKTTTKSAIAAGLSAVFPGALHAEAGNLNNLIGVPMVLLAAQSSHRAAVVELGTNAVGEVQTLAAMAEPDVAVLTLIDLEHTEGLGDLDGVEREEGALFAALGPAGVAIGNADDDRVLAQLAQSPARTRLTYGSSARATYRVTAREQLDLWRSKITIERPVEDAKTSVQITTQLLGQPGALAVAAALCVAEQLAPDPLDLAAFQRAVESLGGGEPGRLRPVSLADGSVVIDDTYNANPVSVLASVATAKEIAAARGARLIVVVGEMRELGSLSIAEHERLGEKLGDCGAAALFAVMGHAEHLATGARRSGLDVTFAADATAALPVVLEQMRPGDVVLVKASRGVRAERIVEGIIRAKGEAS